MTDTNVHISFDVIVEDGFVASEAALVVDCLRIANRYNATSRFLWTYRSTRGGAKTSGAELAIETQRVADRPEADFAIFVGNKDQACPLLAPTDMIRRYSFRGTRVVLLAEAAAQYIRTQGDADSKHTTHWENRLILDEITSERHVISPILNDDGKIITSAGMGSTLDMMLTLIAPYISRASMMMVSNMFLHERIRAATTSQPFGGEHASATGDRELDECIMIMQANLEEPIPIAELARLVSLSSRSLERKFKRFMSTTPHAYYQQLRLYRAQNLLTNTSMTLSEIATACGFSSNFHRVYKDHFGITPNVARRQR